MSARRTMSAFRLSAEKRTDRNPPNPAVADAGGTLIHCRMPTYGQRSAESPGQRLPALVWKIHLLHGAQTRLVQNAAITGDAPGTLSRLGTEHIQGQCAALLKITCKEGYGDRWAGMRGTTGPGMRRIAS